MRRWIRNPYSLGRMRLAGMMAVLIVVSITRRLDCSSHLISLTDACMQDKIKKRQIASQSLQCVLP
jgi:hypothetical protein